jgi:hypothetical protein
MGPGRSIDAVYAGYVNMVSTGRQPPTLKRYTLGEWSRRYDWVRRAAAYDADITQQARLAQIAAISEMNERHVNLARAMLGIVARRLQSLQPEDLSPADTVRWAEALSKLERLARGEASDRIDVFTRVRSLARELGLSKSEEEAAVEAAENIIKSGIVDANG